MKKCADKPCPTCPWRKTSSVGGYDIPGFDLDKMRGLLDTVPPAGTEADGLYKVMACHHSKEGEEYACAGYIARHGWQNINVRLMSAMYGLNIHKIVSNCDGLELYDNFHQMLADYEAVHE